MENISLLKLQELANIIAEEPNVSVRQTLSAWITEKTMGHGSLSGLHTIAIQSSLKDEIEKWANGLNEVAPAQPVYIPDIPAQMEKSDVEVYNDNNVIFTDEETHLQVLATINTEMEKIKPKKRTPKKKED